MPRRAASEEIDDPREAALVRATALRVRYSKDARFKDEHHLKLDGLIDLLRDPSSKPAERLAGIKMVAEMIEAVDAKEPPDSLREKPTTELIQLLGSLKTDGPADAAPAPRDPPGAGAPVS